MLGAGPGAVLGAGCEAAHAVKEEGGATGGVLAARGDGLVDWGAVVGAARGDGLVDTGDGGLVEAAGLVEAGAVVGTVRGDGFVKAAGDGFVKAAGDGFVKAAGDGFVEAIGDGLDAGAVVGAVDLPAGAVVGRTLG